MDLTTIDIPVEDAKAFLDDYRNLVASERTREDEAIAAGYRAAARGLPVISMSATIQAGGYFDSGLPRLAVARADWTQCWVRIPWSDGDIVFSEDEMAGGRNRGSLVAPQTIRVPTPDRPSGRLWRGSTIVPIVPPRFRPRGRKLKSHHVLWEVESWTMIPPKDPALLRHIRGDLWSVLAVWDLTDLERAVLSQRAR
jgi:hypothetical protein